MKLVTLHWTQHRAKAAEAYNADGPLGDVANLDIKEGRHAGSKVGSPWYADEVKRRAGDPAAVAQELDIAYLSSGYPCFSPEWARYHLEHVQQASMRTQPIVANELTHETVTTVIHQQREDGEFWWFCDRDFMLITKKHKDAISPILCCGVDTAEGLGNQDSDPDYSAIVLWDPAKGRPVGCFRSRVVSPADLAAIVADLAKRFDMLLVVERNGPGLTVLSTLAGLLTGYVQETDMFLPVKYASQRGVSEREPGFRTTASSKHMLIELIRYHTDPTRGTLLDRRLVDEYTLFAHLAGRKQGAPVGHHDDLVMALGLALVAAKDSSNYIREPTVETPGDVTMLDMAEDIRAGRLSDEKACEQMGIR